MLSTQPRGAQQHQQRRRRQGSYRCAVHLVRSRALAQPACWRARNPQRSKRGELLVGHIGFDFGDGERESRRRE